MEEKISGIFLTVQLSYTSALHQALKITNFFALKGYMYPLTVKFIRVINQTENNEVYTVFNHNCPGEMYGGGYILHIPTTVYTSLEYMRKYHMFLHLYHYYNSMNA